MPAKRYVVVGASLAGLRAVETLRRKGVDGSITLVGAEPHLPYDRPPLSKAFLDDETVVEPFFRTVDQLAELDVDLRLGVEATGLDPHAGRLQTTDGDVPYDGLVIATGARANRLPDELPGVHTLRTLADAWEIRSALDAGARTVVVGAGFIGAEVASAARKRGLPVTMIEAAPVPLSRSVGAQVGELLADLHRAHGTRLRLGVGVDGIVGDTRVHGVRLTDGSVVEADLVVVGVGARPATGWLESSGVALHPRDGGVVCDATLSTNLRGVVAAGDVAHWINPLFNRSMRLEHWTSTAEQAAAAAANLLTDKPLGYRTVPYFWSDWYGSRIQFVGVPDCDETVVVEPASHDEALMVLYRTDERITGALTVNYPNKIMKFRRLIGLGGSWSEAVGLAYGSVASPVA